MNASVLSIQRCPGHRKPMAAADPAEFVANLGISGDIHALPDSSRQVLLIEKETLDALGLPVGVVKENVTTVGIDLMSLPRKTRLLLGAGVVLEVTKPCEPCGRMDEVRPGLKDEIDGRRGMLARVVAGGLVRRGDPITVLEG